MRTQLHSGTLIAALALATCGLSAQSVQFQIEKNVLNVPTDRSQTFLYGGTFDGHYTRGDLTTIANSIVQASQTDPAEAATQLQSLVNNFSNWGSIAESSGTGPFANFDWISVPPLDAPAGATIYLLILSTDINSISTSTRVGIVTASAATVPPSGSSALPIGFSTGTYHWDDAVMGAFASGGTFDLQAIPEPATTALLCVALITGCVVVRRRR